MPPLFDLNKRVSSIDFYLLMLFIFRAFDIILLYFKYSLTIVVYFQVISIVWGLFCISNVSSIYEYDREQRYSYLNHLLLLALSAIIIACVYAFPIPNTIMVPQIAAIAVILLQALARFIPHKRVLIAVTYSAVGCLIAVLLLIDTDFGIPPVGAFLPELLGPGTDLIVGIAIIVFTFVVAIIRKDKFFLILSIAFVPLWAFGKAFSLAVAPLVFIVISFSALILMDFDKQEGKKVVWHSSIAMIYSMVFIL